MNQRGLTLLELIVAIAILTTVILGVAFLFSTGKGNVDRLSWRRAALAAAQERLEELRTPASTAETTAVNASVNQMVHLNASALKLAGVRTASEYWHIWWEDDPVDALKASNPPDDTPWDNKRVREVVIWSNGIGANKDSVVIESILPG